MHASFDILAGPRIEVLLAEDDRELRRWLALALRKDGYRVAEAETGIELIDQLWERASFKGGFDVIISDVYMPGFTGIEALDALRNFDPRDDYEPQIRDTPIILITSFADATLRKAASRLGAVVFDKPFDIDELRALVVKLVRDPRYREHGGSD
jgi:CheY-like chemotaxis protein